MPWTSLAMRVSDLPLVIAGPILRRVETQSVSVWIACKEATTELALAVYDDQKRLLMLSDLTDTTQLGDHLHVVVLTAVPLGPGPGLSPGVIYSYDILFPNIGQLGSAGILNSPSSSVGAIEKIAYGNRDLPSFVVPPAIVGDLNIVHGSCRKPHGGKTDGLRALDIILESTHDSDPSLRPQQLILTGDQIYADDVADVLLFMLYDAATTTLLGWDETPTLPGGVSYNDLEWGKRENLVKQNNITSSHAKNHLVLLGEYYAMYLFAWSPELWPSILPDFNDVYPGENTHEVFRTAYGNPVRVATSRYTSFYEERAAVNNFFQSLPLVRKVLANISSYMIFDDHEITDDWFLNQEWCENALNGLLSRRIIQNGLSAFAVFQMWGNAPTEFQTGQTGGDLLQKLETLNNNRGNQPGDWVQIGDLLLPQLVSVGGANKKLDSDFCWNFNINFLTYQMIVLDTRTRREFSSKSGPPNLISASDYPSQLPASAGLDLTLLVSAAPVTGHNLVEETLQPVARVFVGSTAVDYEAWSLNEEGFQNLLKALVPYRQVVILSGDVHYAFSNSIEYWDERGQSVERACYVQLCASSFKNEVWGTNALACELLGPRMKSEWAGWEIAGYHVSVKSFDPSEPPQNRYVRGTPAMHRLIEDVFHHFDTPPEWRYRITFAKDTRSEAARGISGPVSVPSHARQALAFHHRRRRDWDAQRIIVGRDNLGSIQLEWGGTQKVWHDLWYVPEGDESAAYLLHPYTRHIVPLTIPSSSPPGET